MTSLLLLALAWIYAAFGLHTVLHVVPWSDRFIFVRWLPKPAEPDTVNASRVVGTVCYALVAFVFWPLLWRQQARRLAADGDAEHRGHPGPDARPGADPAQQP